jgi:hypothetical protein
MCFDQKGAPLLPGCPRTFEGSRLAPPGLPVLLLLLFLPLLFEAFLRRLLVFLYPFTFLFHKILLFLVLLRPGFFLLQKRWLWFHRKRQKFLLCTAFGQHFRIEYVDRLASRIGQQLIDRYAV